MYGLLGPNGAGKSTLLKIILRLVYKDSGEIYILNENIENNKYIGRNIGALIEYPSFYEYLNGFDNLSLYANLYGLSKDNVVQAINLVGLKNDYKKKVKYYSMGMKQRLSIARTFLHNPSIIILDEPTNGLDPIGAEEIEKLIIELSRNNNKTFIITSHILPQIQKICNKVAIMNNGYVVSEGKVNELLDSGLETYKITLSTSIEHNKISLESDFIKKKIIKSNVLEVTIKKEMFGI